MTGAAPPSLACPASRPRLGRAIRARPLGLVGLGIVAVMALAALLAPLLVAHGPLDQAARRFLPPGAGHLFGTDQLGRDVFARVVYGARVSLPYGFQLVVMAGAVGTAAGAVAGYFGGWVDGLIMRAADLVMAFPDIILAMAVAAALGPGLFNAVLAVAVVNWPIYARLVRAMILTLRDEPYVHASRLLGFSAARALWVDVRPNIVGPVIVLAALEFGHAILLLAGLSFLGLGAQPPEPEWGAMVADGSRYFDKWWMSVFPGAAIMAVVLAANFIGDTLRDMLDPRTAGTLR